MRTVVPTQTFGYGYVSLLPDLGVVKVGRVDPRLLVPTIPSTGGPDVPFSSRKG